MKRQRAQMVAMARQLVPEFLSIAGVAGFGIFGSLVRGTGSVGDLDLLVLVDDSDLAWRAAGEIQDEGYSEGHFGQLALLYGLADARTLNVVDRIFSLGKTWCVKLDIFLFPSQPTKDFLDYYYGMTTWGFLWHIATYTKVFEGGQFVPNRFDWAEYTRSIGWMRDFAIMDGWGHLLGPEEY